MPPAGVSREKEDLERSIAPEKTWTRADVSLRTVHGIVLRGGLCKTICINTTATPAWAGYEDCSGATGEEKSSLLHEFSNNSAPGLTAFTDAILGGFQKIGKRNELIHPIEILKSDLRRLGKVYSPSSSGFSGAATDATGVIPFSSSARLNAGISLSRRF